MNSKGQLFSLDFIIAMAFVILAIGMLYRQAEVFQYNQKDDAIQSELYRIGLNASNQLAGNPANICQLADSATVSSPLIIDYLPNCLTVAKNTTSTNFPKGEALGWYKNHGKEAKIIFKANLGIPEGYGCSLKLTSNDLPNDWELLTPKNPGGTDEKGCPPDSLPADALNVFSIERTVVFLYESGVSNSGRGIISKQEFNDCINSAGNCVLKEASVSLQVWRE